MAVVLTTVRFFYRVIAGYRIHGAQCYAREDALNVNASLTEVQGEIEQIRGRMEYLQQSAAFSFIRVDIHPVPSTPPIVGNSGWNPFRVAREALGGLVLFGQGLAELAIVLIVWTPVWVPLVLFTLWLWRTVWKPNPASEEQSS